MYEEQSGSRVASSHARKPCPKAASAGASYRVLSRLKRASEPVLPRQPPTSSSRAPPHVVRLSDLTQRGASGGGGASSGGGERGGGGRDGGASGNGGTRGSRYGAGYDTGGELKV